MKKSISSLLVLLILPAIVCLSSLASEPDSEAKRFVPSAPNPPAHPEYPKSDNPLLQTLNRFKPIDIKGLNDLLEKGEPVNILAKDEYGVTETPLTKAVKRIAPNQSNATNVRHGESVEAVKILLNHGADPNLPNGDGLPPLFIAASEGDVPAMELLISKGALTDKPYKNQNGQEIGLVENTAGDPYSYNAFIYLLEKGIPFDPDRVLKKLNWNDLHEEGLRALLAYPVLFSDATLDECSSSENQQIKAIGKLIRKHNEIIKNAEAVNQPPKLMFKPAKAVIRQIEPPNEDSALVQAIANKDLVEIKKLVENGADVNSVTSRNSSLKEGYQRLAALPALNLALTMKSRDIAIYLLDHGADPDLTDGGDQENNPLAITISIDDAEMVQKLIEKGADVNREIWNIHHTPLSGARSVAVAKLLLDVGADPLSADTMHGIVAGKNMDIVRLVLSRGGRLDQASMADGDTPLHRYIKESYSAEPDPAYVQFLVENGAPLDVLNYTKQTPYDLAVVHKFTRIADILSEKGGTMGDPQTALANAIIQSDVASATRALNALGKIRDQKILLNLTNYQTKQINLKMLELLTEHGADYSEDFGEQGTLLHNISDPLVIDYLVAHGAKVDARSIWHKTPLHVMVARHEVAAVKSLLEHKAFVNATDEYNATPLCIALQGPQDQRPADGPAVDWQKDPEPYLEIVKLLALAGADPQITDERGCRPWHSEPEYEHFRDEAEKILKANAAPVAKKMIIRKHGRFEEVPYKESNALFMAVREYFLKKDHEVQPVHPIIQQARELYRLYPKSADSFADFLKRTRYHPDGSVRVWRSGPDSGLQDDTDETLLHTSAYYGDLDLASQIINVTGPIRLIDKNKKTAMFYAVAGSSLAGVERALKMVDLLKDKGGESLNDFDQYGDTPLAGPYGSEIFKDDEPTNVYQMIRGMLDRGADPALGDCSRSIADMMQARKKSAMELKCEKAAQAYQSLLDDLSGRNILPGQKKKSGKFDRDNPLHMAVASLKPELVKKLISEGQSFKTRQEAQMLIVSAVSSGDRGLEMAQLLIDNGAVLEAEDPGLWAAALQQNETKKMVDFVLSHAAPSVNALSGIFFDGRHSDSWGEALGLLLERGVAMNYCTDNPLSKAISSNDVTAVNILLQYGARKDACPDRIITPDISSNKAIKELLAE